MRANAIRIVVPVALTMALAGCGAIGAIGIPMGRDRNPPARPQDQTMAAPTTPVESAQLPPLGQPVDPGYDPGPAADQPILAEEAPPPRTPANRTDPAQTAALAANAPEIGRTDLLGGWTVTSGSDTCQLFMTLTTWTGGYRASTRGCATPALTSISAWNLDGKQVILNSGEGKAVARLYSAGDNHFNGQLETGGQSVAFFR